MKILRKIQIQIYGEMWIVFTFVQVLQLFQMTAIIAVFLVSFGVVEFALLFPRSQLSIWTARDMFTLSFWQMFMMLYQDTVIRVRPPQ